MTLITRLAPLAVLLATGCNDVEVPAGCHLHGDELHCDDNHGLATTVVLTFTPTAGGEALTFTWSDPEDDGDPLVVDIVLPDGSDDDQHEARAYTLGIEVLNELEDPTEDVTVEIADQAEVHQFFFTGSAVVGPASDSPNAVISQAYADADENGLPLGLENTIETVDRGSGELTITLRHMPAEDGSPVKTADLAEQVASDGFGDIGGGNDIDVDFNIEVE